MCRSVITWSRLHRLLRQLVVSRRGISLWQTEWIFDFVSNIHSRQRVLLVRFVNRYEEVICKLAETLRCLLWLLYGSQSGILLYEELMFHSIVVIQGLNNECLKSESIVNAKKWTCIRWRLFTSSGLNFLEWDFILRRVNCWLFRIWIFSRNKHKGIERSDIIWRVRVSLELKLLYVRVLII